MIKYQCAECDSICKERMLCPNPPQQQIICPKCGETEYEIEETVVVKWVGRVY